MVELAEKKYKLRPLGERILCAPIEEEEKVTSSGLLIAKTSNVDPKKAKEVYIRAEVIAVGPKVKDVKVGDLIALLDFQYTTVEYDFKDYIICTEWDIDVIFDELNKDIGE